jgi:hypothetical protein
VARREAARLVGNTAGTVVGGRTLRNRATLKPPTDPYWENHGKHLAAAAWEKDDKKEMLKLMRAAAAKGEFTLGNLTLRNSLGEIKAEYRRYKQAVGLPDTEEESDGESSIESDDEDEDDSDEDDSDTDESEDDDSDSEAEAEAEEEESESEEDDSDIEDVTPAPMQVDEE